MEYTYYGRNDGSKPKQGIEYMIVDIYIEKCMEKAMKRFTEEMMKTIRMSKNEFTGDLSSIKKDLAVIKKEILVIRKESSKSEKIKDK